MLSKSPMLYGFADEMEKISYAAKKSKAKKDDLEPNMNFYERHPKAILGGSAAALIGGALLSRKLKKKPGPGMHIPKSPGEAFSDKERSDFPRKILKYFKRSSTPRLESPKTIKPTEHVQVGGKLGPEDMNIAIDKAFRGGRINVRKIDKPPAGHHMPDSPEKSVKPKTHKK